MRIAAGMLAFVTVVAAARAGANGFDPRMASFSVTLYGETSPYRDTSAFVLPNAKTTVEAVGGRAGKYSLEAKEGTVVQQGARRWQFVAPARPGLYLLKLDGPENRDSIDIHLFVMVPASQVRGGYLNGYRIGAYPAPSPGASARYAPPKGFVEVTKDNQDTRISPHFTLKQFLCKQEPLKAFPKYVVLEPRLLLKLEAILAHVNRRLGFSVDTLNLVSAYRTPYYNHAIGDVKFSMHQFGGAADIYVDPKDDDQMADLNRDGQIDVADAKFLYDRIEELFAPPTQQKFEGGLGFYPATAAHPPFVHVDVRGTKARWKG
jgi:hypothetical protein